MNMSYSKGWKLIRRASDELGIELVKTMSGGQDGGKSILTEV